MVAPAAEGIDLFKIAGRSISGWIPSLKTGTAVRQPFCSQLEERLLLWLEYHPQVKSYARGDIGPQFATMYRLPIPKHAPFAIGYTFEDKPHHYLPDVVGTLTNGKPFIAEAGMEDDKRGDRNQARAEAARRLSRLHQGIFWIGTEKTLTRQRHYNLVFLHARRKTFAAFADIAAALQEVWPWGEMAPVCDVASRLEHEFPVDLVEAAIWKVVGDSAAQGHLLVDLEQFTLDRTLPLALLPPDAPPLVPAPLPDTLLPEPVQETATISREPRGLIPGPTFDASTLPEPQREQFHRNLRAVSQVLAGATQTSVAEKAQNRKTPHHGYRTSSGNRLSFQGRWYICPGLLSRLAGREFDVYYDRRDVGVLYIFVEGEYVGEAYCPELMGGRVSEWEARAMRKHDEQQAKIAREQGLPVRARIQEEARAARRRRSTEIRASEQARQWDRQRQDIHPTEVAQRLARIEAPIPQVLTLPEAVPDADPDRPVRVLPVRYVQREERLS